jgi:peptide/nickel transport system substrate-binding protein
MKPRNLVLWLVIASLGAGCARASDPASGESPRESLGPRAEKKIVAAIVGDPVVLTTAAELGGASVPGTGEINDLMHLGLTGGAPPEVAPNGRRAILADTVPAFENSLWKVSPDGRMELTWRLRESARWHDGTPVTAADLLFTAQVIRDAELVNFRGQLSEIIDRVETPDARTVVVHFTSPHIDADQLFGLEPTKPLPRHLLESAYRGDKSTFMTLPYWGAQFVGAGPFKLREWEPGSHLILDANPDFVLGRPKVDVIEVRFIPDGQAFVANFLAGTVELRFSRGLNADQANELDRQWQHGKVIYAATTSAYQVFPQFLDPNPSVIGTDVRFRRAMLQAIDRQVISDTFFFGRSSVAHAYLVPGEPGYAEIEPTVKRYEYDERGARQLLEEIGYRRGANGMYHDSTNQPLAVEIRNFGIAGPATVVVADFWQRAGVKTDIVIVPQQLSRDNEYRMTFPGFQLLNNPAGIAGMRNLHSRFVALPANNYVVNNNKSRYANPTFDDWVDRYFVTIPLPERIQLLRQIVGHLATELPVLPLVYNIQPRMQGHRLLNFTVPTEQAGDAWNPEQWDVKS